MNCPESHRSPPPATHCSTTTSSAEAGRPASKPAPGAKSGTALSPTSKGADAGYCSTQLAASDDMPAGCAPPSESPARPQPAAASHTHPNHARAGLPRMLPTLIRRLDERERKRSPRPPGPACSPVPSPTPGMARTNPRTAVEERSCRCEARSAATIASVTGCSTGWVSRSRQRGSAHPSLATIDPGAACPCTIHPGVSRSCPRFW